MKSPDRQSQAGDSAALSQTHPGSSLETMAVGTAHDFGNFLGAILGNAAALLQSLEPGSPEHDAAQLIDRTARQASNLIDRLYAYSGRSALTMDDLDMAALLTETVEALRRQIGHSVRLDCSCEQDLPLVAADADRLRQAVTELVLNACDAIDGEGVITISAGQSDAPARDDAGHGLIAPPPGPRVYVDISDTGHGMADCVKERAFDPFFSTKMRGQGLGLSYVMGIVRAHHGALELRTTPGNGTVVRLVLPCVPAQIH